MEKLIFAVIQHNRKRIFVFSRKMNAEYFQVESLINKRQRAQFKEVNNLRKLPRGYKVITCD